MLFFPLEKNGNLLSSIHWIKRVLTNIRIYNVFVVLYGVIIILNSNVSEDKNPFLMKKRS
jgi:hypothetical protein